LRKEQLFSKRTFLVQVLSLERKCSVPRSLIAQRVKIPSVLFTRIGAEANSGRLFYPPFSPLPLAILQGKVALILFVDTWRYCSRDFDVVAGELFYEPEKEKYV
jgi:hypothetical protein